MLPWSLNETAALTGGRVRGDGTKAATGVSIDTRTLKRGDLYVAIRGHRFDGHAFVQEAVRRGAVGAMVERAIRGAKFPQVVVKDTDRALGDLGRAQRLQWNGPVVAVTGSAGKTTVKDMAAHLLGGEPTVLKTRGNLNNQYGLPLTLLGLNARHKAAVVELGINHPGEMEWLTRVARPDVAVVTNIGLAHIGNFGSRKVLAREKSGIAAGLNTKGVLVMNVEDTRWVPRKVQEGHAVLTFGMGQGAVQAAEVRPDGPRTHFTLTAEGEQASTWVALPGGHNVKNALAAVSAVLALGGRVKPLAWRMRSFRSEAPMRLEMVRKKGVLFVNDAYNSSPTSVPAALEAFRQIEVPGRKCAVLGDMLELGFFSNHAHESALRQAFDERLDFWVLVGPRMGSAFRKAVPETWVKGVANRRAFHVQDAQEALLLLKNYLQRGDAVLLKASRGLKLESIQEAF